MAKPTPKVVSEVCSLCGLDWALHGKAPTAETCVKLLLDEVSALNARLAHRPFVLDRPYIIPSIPRPYYPHWYTSWQVSSAGRTPAAAAARYANGIAPGPVSIFKGRAT